MIDVCLFIFSDTYASSKSAKRSLKGGNTLVFNCDSSKCGPKATGRAEMQLLEKLTVTNQMEHLTINVKHAQNLFCPEVLMALLKAVPIIISTGLKAITGLTKCAMNICICRFIKIYQMH